MSFKRSPLKPQSRRAPGALRQRVRYIEDPNEPSHQGKTIEPAQNRLCAEGPDAFIAACLQARRDYRSEQQNRPGRKTNDLFLEYIYCTPDGVDLSEDERTQIATRHIQRFCPYSPSRHAWHHNPGYKKVPRKDPDSGKTAFPTKFDPSWQKWDLHILAAAVTLTFPRRATRWGISGNGKNHELAEFDAADVETTNLLNRWKSGDFRDARQVRREALARKDAKRAVPLYRQLAADLTEITLKTIVPRIEKLGYKVKAIGQKTIEVIFADGQKAFRFRLSLLINRVNLEIQRRRDKNKNKAKDDPGIK